MKSVRKTRTAIVQLTAAELRNPRIAAIVRKAQGMPPAEGEPMSGPGAAVDPAAEVASAGMDLGGGAELPTGDDNGGDGLQGREKFMEQVGQAYQDAYGKPMNEGMKKMLDGMIMMSRSSEKSDELGDDMTTPSDSDPGVAGADMGADPAMPGSPGHGSPMGDTLANSRGRLTKVASTRDWVAKLASKLS